MDRVPDRSSGDADDATASAGTALFAAFGDLLSGAVVRRPNVPLLSANASAVDVTSPSLRFGATAALPEPGRPVFRFTRGTCLAFADAAVHLIARPDFMPESPIVRADVKSVEPGQFRARFIDYDGGGADQVLRPLHAFAAGDDRLATFDKVFAMAVRFVALHEQAHYYNGHLHAVRTADVAELPEVGRAVGPSMPRGFRRRVEQCLGMDWPRASRALELQADAWAVRHLLGFGRRPDADHGPRDRGDEEKIPAVDWLRHAMLGVACGVCDLRSQRPARNNPCLTAVPSARRSPDARRVRGAGAPIAGYRAWHGRDGRVHGRVGAGRGRPV